MTQCLENTVTTIVNRRKLQAKLLGKIAVAFQDFRRARHDHDSVLLCACFICHSIHNIVSKLITARIYREVICDIAHEHFCNLVLFYHRNGCLSTRDLCGRNCEDNLLCSHSVCCDIGFQFLDIRFCRADRAIIQNTIRSLHTENTIYLWMF